MTDSDGSLKVPGWQVKLVASLLLAAISGGVVNYLSFRDWRVRTDLTLEQIKSATSLPRTEWEIERRNLVAADEQLRVRIEALERARP